jgi:hypothetical protein
VRASFFHNSVGLSQIEQMLEMYEAGGAGMIYHGMDEGDVKRIMQEPFTMIASDSGVRQADESDTRLVRPVCCDPRRDAWRPGNRRMRFQ